MRFGSICSGIEAASVAWNPLGWECQWMSEIEPFARKVLQSRFPSVPLHGDFTALDPAALPPVDVLVGGTPCVSFALRGKREGLADPRGQLTLSFVELVHGLADRSDRPLRYALWENVPRVLRSRSDDNGIDRSDFGCFLAGLVGADADLDCAGGVWPNIGMVAGPRGRAAWRVFDAQYFGVPQRRPRLYLVFCPGDQADPASVLFERKGRARHACQGGQPWQAEASAEAGEGSEGSEALGVLQDVDVPVYAYHMGWNGFERSITDIAPTLTHGDDRGESGVMTVHGPRTFTPVERERLMGFPDRWTEVSWRGKPAWQAPVGKRIGVTGNSMAVPVIRWIGERIEAAERDRALAAA